MTHEQERPRDVPYRLAFRVLADLLVMAGVAGAGLFALSWAQGTVPPAREFPWSQVIQGGATLLVGLLTFLLRAQVKELHVTMNSKMDRLLEVTRTAALAEGVLEGRRQGVALAAKLAEGQAQGKPDA